VALGVAVDHQSVSARGGAAGPGIGLLLSRRRPERRSLVYPDYRIQHPYHGTEEGAVPAAAERLGNRPGIRPEDVFVYILEAAKENCPWATASRDSPEARRCSFQTGFDMS